jgi:bifunctional non-homologous end joining protein LigD
VAFDLRPMLASLTDAPLADPHFVYEPKYDGIRAIVEISAKGEVRLWSRLGNEKTRQFPEIARAFEEWARRRKSPLVLDGEIVALDADGRPTGFQQLQGRINLGNGSNAAPGSKRSRGGRAPTDEQSSVAILIFDLLRDDGTDYRDRPLTERRTALERLFARSKSPVLRVSTQVRGDGRALYDEAMASGWEGLIAKQAASLYKSGKRTPDWRKMKIVHEQEFVIGGWTEPRQSRGQFGALLIGVYDGRGPERTAPHRGSTNPKQLIYAGHIGTGFNERELVRIKALLEPLEIASSPFVETPKANERPHWVKPELVAQVKFTEWTTDGRLRHPVYLGLRDDKKAKDVTREKETSVVRRSTFEVRRSDAAPPAKAPRTRRTTNAEPGTKNAKRRTSNDDLSGLLDQLTALESTRKDGVLTLPDGEELAVTNLHKVFWPKQKLTKGDLFRYYVRASPYLLPAIADRALVMKRFPNGVSGPPFYQHRAPDVPAGIRTAIVGGEQRPQIVGGELKTLLYTTQLAAISQDPWFSRVAHPEFADFAAFDLDPVEGVSFEKVLEVARWIRDELDTLDAVGVPKTSGADGLHIYVPMPAGTPYDAGLLFCQIVAALVVQKHPKLATTERAVKARGARVYIDCLQNIMGKTLAGAYSARASDFAGVSTPVTWQEVDEGFDRQAFTIATAPERFERVGDLWAALRKSRGVNLEKVARLEQKK